MLLGPRAQLAVSWAGRVREDMERGCAALMVFLDMRGWVRMSKVSLM